ncbi:MAG TPA: hypothetical protein VEF04_03685 [Blastocatellia bacterium]|nr:hypothetical protein [Blastocatellia bacterium]
MQIGCKKFGCQKAVEVCYWSCKHRRNCKDWRSAIETQPGEVAIRERLEAAAAKNGRLFDVTTLISPGRPKRIVTPPAVSLLTAPASNSVTQKKLDKKRRPARRIEPVKAVAEQSIARPIPRKKTQQKERIKKMAKPQLEENPIDAPEAIESSPMPKASAPKPKKKAAAKPKQATTGTVYLLLSSNGKYRELRESELMTEAAVIIKDPSLRLVKGQFLVPQISFRPSEE